MNVLLCVSGSVAAVLTHKLEVELRANNHIVRTVITESAKHFMNNIDRNHLTDQDEWNSYKRSREVLHINLVREADVILIAPCTANTLAKLANGLADNLLTSCARAWNFDKGPMIIAPAMNTRMWEHPITQRQIDMLKSFSDNVIIVPPQVKTLFCKETGSGALANISDIITTVNQYESSLT